MSVGSRSEKFNIVHNDHGRTQKCNFRVSVCKTNFTDHHTPDTINGYRDSVLVCTMQDRYFTIRKNFEHFHSLSSGLRIKRLQRLDHMETNHFKMLLNVFSTTHTYSNSKVYRLLLNRYYIKNNLTNICSKISKIGMNFWMV